MQMKKKNFEVGDEVTLYNSGYTFDGSDAVIKIEQRGYYDVQLLDGAPDDVNRLWAVGDYQMKPTKRTVINKILSEI
jgi:hypothetical protein